MTDCTCGRRLIFLTGNKMAGRVGWVHEWPPGSERPGSAYWLRCDNCHWEGAPYPVPTHCPKCGEPAVRDDHCAMPDRNGKVGCHGHPDNPPYTADGE